MAISTGYEDVVNIQDTKTYLRIDDGQDETDTEILLMINSACSMIEKYTQHFLYPRNESYRFNYQGLIRIYASPINSVVTPATNENNENYEEDQRTLYSNYCRRNPELQEMTFNVGYEECNDVPDILKLAVMEAVRVWFYNAENNAQKGVLPQTVMAMLGEYKRFIF